MADTPKTPSGKKLPKWAIPVGIAGVLALVIVLRKKKGTSSSATEPGAQGLTNQSFIPVTGENVAGVGAGNYGEHTSTNNEAYLREFLKEQNEEGRTRRAEEKVEGQTTREREQSFYEKIIGNLGAGGGAPSSQGAPGTTTAPPETHAAPPSPSPQPQPPAPPAPPTPVASCPPGWKHNPAYGAPSPHSCYHESRETCHSGKCHIHGYQDGHEVCPC